jgi:3-oxoacyl-[acyl-carrier protein] reductase
MFGWQFPEWCQAYRESGKNYRGRQRYVRIRLPVRRTEYQRPFQVKRIATAGLAKISRRKRHMSQTTVLVTGSSRGIGKAIALRLAREGYDIVLHCRSRLDEADQVKHQIVEMGRQARVLCFDLADRSTAKDRLEDDIKAHGAYYGVVCNAGLSRDNAFPAMSEEDWDQVLRSNLDGFYNVLYPLVLPMIQRRKPGRIVTLSSVSGLVGNRGQVNYSAAKAGIIGATKALAVELAKRKITVNCVAPGLIETEMVEGLPLEEALAAVPARRLGTPEEVAALVAFLMSEDAAYITRQVISVNGGLC